MNGSKGRLVLLAAEKDLHAYRIADGDIGPFREGEDLYVEPGKEVAAGDVVVTSHPGAGLAIGRLLDLPGGAMATEDLAGGPTFLVGDLPAMRYNADRVAFEEDPSRRVQGTSIVGPVTRICTDTPRVFPMGA